MKENYRDYYYKYKALKYYLKNNTIEKQKQIKGGDIQTNNPNPNNGVVKFEDTRNTYNEVNLKINGIKNNISRLKESIESSKNLLNKSDDEFYEFQDEIYYQTHKEWLPIDDKEEFVTKTRVETKNDIKKKEEEIKNLENFKKKYIKNFIEKYNGHHNQKINRFVNELKEEIENLKEETAAE